MGTTQVFRPVSNSDAGPASARSPPAPRARSGCHGQHRSPDYLRTKIGRGQSANFGRARTPDRVKILASITNSYATSHAGSCLVLPFQLPGTSGRLGQRDRRPAAPAQAGLRHDPVVIAP